MREINFRQAIGEALNEEMERDKNVFIIGEDVGPMGGLMGEMGGLYDKYGGEVLEIDGLPYAELVKWQQRTYLRLYLVNRRFKDCFGFFWKSVNH